MTAASAIGTMMPKKASATSQTRHTSPAATLEDFVYDLQNAPGGYSSNYGNAKEANASEFPVSKSFAAVLMHLEPGAFREMHWHAIAAEWAYILKGRVRTTVISPDNTTSTDDFEPGDIWYFPKGHGHMLQCLGNEPCTFLLGFDNGQFSEFGTFSVTDWISHTSPEIMAHNTGIPASFFATLPKHELYIGTGPIATEPRPVNIDPAVPFGKSLHRFRMEKDGILNEFKGGRERLVSAREFPIQQTLTALRMDIEPGAIRELHWHPNADEWQFVMAGQGNLTLFGSHGRVRTMEYNKGKVAFIQQGFGHYIENTGKEMLKLIILLNSPVYQEISLNDWLKANPPQLIADHFGMSRQQAASLKGTASGIF